MAHRVARVMEDVISTHFPSLNTPIIEPSLRSSDEHHTLALIVASATLREQLRTQFGDQADVRVCLAITAATVAAYLEAGGRK